jgi:pimeloyl-ACP methyl ester carboxylesterase
MIPMPRTLVLAVAGAALALAVAMVTLRGASASAAGVGSTVSAETVRCGGEARELERRTRCGYVSLPLDRSNPGGKRIKVYFELYPRQNVERPALSTVVSIEGGPGYPTTDDRGGRVPLWRPVSERRNLLLVDLRGTGKSGALACRSFAHSTVGYIDRAARCARQLGPARDLYSTSQAVQDIAAILDALGLNKVDLYGDSYGSYAAQAFALRYPERLRSVVLDGTYPLPGSDPGTADLVAAGRRGLRLTCRRNQGCPQAARRDPVGLVSRFVDRVRAHPVVGFGPDGDGTRTRVRVNEDGLVQIYSAGYYFPSLWRELPAAILAARRGDPAPILRLGAETITVDAGGEDPPASSEGLYLAVTCHDYPQLWDPATPIRDRPAELARALAAYPPGAFEPFSGAAWNGTDYEGWQACLRWPSPRGDDPPDPPGAAYPDVPTLVLNGDLDTITASSGARLVARRFPGSTFVEVRNSLHVTALYDHDGCASRIYLRFVRTLEPGDTSCAREVPENHLVPVFATRLAQVPPARGAAKNAASRTDLQLASAAASTIADVVSRWWVNYDGTSVGLHGGRWSYEGDDPVAFTLQRVEFVPGVKVTGAARWGDVNGVVARVTAEGPGGTRARLRISWPKRLRAKATIAGDVAGRRLDATMPAP